MRGGGRAGRDGSKKCKPIPPPPHGAGLKSRPIPAPPPLRSGENLHGAKRGGAGQAGRDKIASPTEARLKEKLFSVFFFLVGKTLYFNI